jgi:hypothetical protein
MYAPTLWERFCRHFEKYRLRLVGWALRYWPLPKRQLGLKLLYERRIVQPIGWKPLRRIRHAWYEASSIQLIVWSAERNWLKFCYACKHSPPDHPMLEEMVELLRQRASNDAQRKWAAELFPNSRYSTSAWEPEKPWPGA